MASTCIPCQADGKTVTFDDAEDYDKHMTTAHANDDTKKKSRPRTPRSEPRKSPRQPRARKK